MLSDTLNTALGLLVESMELLRRFTDRSEEVDLKGFHFECESLLDAYEQYLNGCRKQVNSKLCWFVCFKRTDAGHEFYIRESTRAEAVERMESPEDYCDTDPVAFWSDKKEAAEEVFRYLSEADSETTEEMLTVLFQEKNAEAE